MRFSNRPPIGLEDSTVLAQAEHDGGVYQGIGYDRYIVYRGKRLHLVHAYSSGCDYGSGTDATCNHIGFWESLEELATWLKQQTQDGTFAWWASELLEELGCPPEPA